MSAAPVSSLGPDDLRSLSLSILGRALRVYSMFDDLGAPLVRRDPPPLLRVRNEEEEAAVLRVLVAEVISDRPMAGAELQGIGNLIQRILDSQNIMAAWETFKAVRIYISSLLRSQIVTTTHATAFTSAASQSALDVTANDSTVAKGALKEELDRDIEEQRFVASVMQMCADHRELKDTAFTSDEEIALERAYRLLDQGVRLPRFYRSIDHTAARQTQTYVSFADPGDGHLTVTVRDGDLLKGLIVHIEYIDRDGVDDKDLVEAYRLPAIRNATRVRLHVGDATPCTAFIGRPVFEGGNFDLGLLKAGHTMASVCSAMFAQGIADCKVAMDGMTARQAVDFMRVVVGNVVRDPLRQRLSAAFNLNSPLIDDLISRGAARHVKVRFEIAQLALRLTAMGRFNKIAWDGASNERPGKPILVGQLTRVQLLELVHAAHEKDLETYISAGMKPCHLCDAVSVGVGGVGIGTSLHHLAKDNTIGEIDPDKVKNVLSIQNGAAQTVAGRAARELALLDWEYGQRRLLPALKQVRRDLYATLSGYLNALDQLCLDKDGVGRCSDLNDHAKSPHDLVDRLRASLDQVRKVRADFAEQTAAPAPADRGERTRAFSTGERGGFQVAPGNRAIDTAPGLGPIGDLAQGVLQAYKADPQDSEFTEKSIKAIEALVANGDREGLMRFFPV